jgi:hypothetical protein
MCDDLQHLDKNENVCIYNKCKKCHKILYDVNLNDDDNEENYEKIKKYTLKMLKKIKKSNREEKVKYVLELCKSFTYEIFLNFIETSDQFKIILKDKMTELYFEYQEDLIILNKYYNLIFNENIEVNNNSILSY